MNKPTCEIDDEGNKRWYLNGVYHREDGPAMEFADGHKEWWVNDYPMTKEIAQWAKDADIDLENLTIEDKALIKLIWADYGK